MRDASARARQETRLPDRLLDTTIVSAIMRGDPMVSERLARLPAVERLLLSVITDAEIRYGIHRLPAGQRRRHVEQAYRAVLRRFADWLEITLPVSAAQARIKSALETDGIVLPENDLWIAATALVHNLTMVSKDRHFLAVPGLITEDWSSPP